jgi:hypothetical protein
MKRVLVSKAGYSGTTTRWSTALRPKPTASNSLPSDNSKGKRNSLVLFLYLERRFYSCLQISEIKKEILTAEVAEDAEENNQIILLFSATSAVNF